MTHNPLSAADQVPVVDVAMLSDLRLPGGTTSSIAEEVRAQSEAGLSTALIHAAGTVTTYPNPWSAHIRGVLELPGVQIASPRARLHAKALIIRHPTVIASTPSTFEGITADHVIVVINHAAIDAAGVRHYDVEATDARVRELFDLRGGGRDPVWAPIGPVVRRTVEQQTRRIPLRGEDWLNIFRMPGGAPRRTGFLGDRPVLGRHSRPQPGKWPASKAEILSAYPDSAAYQVEILGGAQIAEKLIGRVPQRWNVVPFGGEDPWEFLKRIDFWVYMHHPHLKEAFGRAAMEALAAGCVAILPPYMGELFGEAAVYGEPKDVTGIIDSFWRDPQRFVEQSRKAQEFAAAYNPQMHIGRLEEFGIRSGTQPVENRSDDPRAPEQRSVGHVVGHVGDVVSAQRPPDETSWNQTLEQWASSYYGTERIAVRRTLDFAPQKAPIPKHFYGLPVLLVVMTRRCPELHAALCEGVERLREATYGFRAVAFTDSLDSAGLRSMDWAVEQCYAEEDWQALSLQNWLTYAAEQLMWTQQQYGASTVVAPDSSAGLQGALAHVAEVFDAPAAVLRTAQGIAAEMVREASAASRDGVAPEMPPSPRGLFGGLPMGQSELLPAERGSRGLLTVRRRQEAYGVVLALRTPEAERLLDSVDQVALNHVLVAPELSASAPLLRAAGQALCEHGPVLLVADGVSDDGLAGAGADGLLRLVPSDGRGSAGEGREKGSEARGTGEADVEVIMGYGGHASSPAVELPELLRTVQEVHARSLAEPDTHQLAAHDAAQARMAENGIQV